MLQDKLKKSLSLISELLNNYEDPDKTLEKVFDYLNQLLDNQKAYIFFLSPNGVYLKSQRGCNEEESFRLQKVRETGFSTRKFLKDKKTLIDDNNIIAMELGVGDNKKSSFIVSPLKIKDAIFGFLVIEKESLDAFDKTDIEVVGTFSAIAAYIIKDAELSDVFKLQLKILQENIIEKTEACKVIKEQNKQIIEANRVKEEFLANVSHELRTPLNAILNFSEALRSEILGDLNPKQQDYVNEINASATHLAGVINEILDISKIEANQMSLNKSNFNVSQGINEVISVIRSLAKKKKISIKSAFSDEDLIISADFKKFQQIFYNLLSNSIKYTKEKGQVEVGFSVEGEIIHFYVKDNGIGIDPKYHGKIFGKFQQVENVYTKTESSTGLGLTITKEFIEMHNGKIWLESMANKGTTFRFELPIS